MHAFWPPAIPSHSDNSYGFGALESTQPIIAVVNDVSPHGTIDMATYYGVPLP